VYAPGTAADLAASAGVLQEEAEEAQEAASTFVEHTSYGMMWACIDTQQGCDSATLATNNEKMARRSAAYNLSEHTSSRISVQTNVQSVAEDRIAFANGSSLQLLADEAVILSAGALASPQLLGLTSFSGNNHYYNYSYVTDRPYPYPTQNFRYAGDPVQYEFNDAKVNEYAWMTIQMEMNSSKREQHAVGQSYSSPPDVATQAWHFAGTMPHNSKLQVLQGAKYLANVYTGDAGALMTPFNCHTSMPAVAVGVMAAKSAVNQLQTAAISNVTTGDGVQAKLDRAAWPVHCYIAAVFVAVFGVWCHTTGTEYGRYLHYGLMWTSFILMLVPTIFLNQTYATSVAGSTHKTLGYVIVVWMTVQAIAGSVVAYYNKQQANTEPKSQKPQWLKTAGIVHRLSGFALLGLICGQSWLAKQGTSVHFASFTTYYAVAAAYSTLLLAVLLVATHIYFNHRIAAEPKGFLELVA